MSVVLNVVQALTVAGLLMVAGALGSLLIMAGSLWLAEAVLDRRRPVLEDRDPLDDMDWRWPA